MQLIRYNAVRVGERDAAHEDDRDAKGGYKGGVSWQYSPSLKHPARLRHIMSVTSFFLASILSLAAAGPTFQTFVVQESLSSAPQGFAKVGPAADSSSLNLRIALPSKDVAGLEQALLDVSTPSSSNYGNHLTKAEVRNRSIPHQDFYLIDFFHQVNAFVAPTDEAVAAVQAWLASHGLVANKSSSSGDWLAVTVPVSKANDMLSAKYETFTHIASGKTYARTLAFSLPTEVADFIDHIHPTTTFNNPVSLSPVLSVPQPASAVSADAAASCATTITPSTHFPSLSSNWAPNARLSVPPIPLQNPHHRRHRVIEQHRRCRFH